VIFIVTTISQLMMSWPLILSWFYWLIGYKPSTPLDPWTQESTPKREVKWYHWVVAFVVNFAFYGVVQVLRRRRVAEIIMEADRKHCRFGYHTFWGGMTYRRLPISYISPKNATRKNLIVRVRGDYIFSKHFIPRRKCEILEPELLSEITGFSLPRLRTVPAIQATFNLAQRIQEAKASKLAARAGTAPAASTATATATSTATPAATAVAPPVENTAAAQPATGTYMGRRSRMSAGITSAPGAKTGA